MDAQSVTVREADQSSAKDTAKIVIEPVASKVVPEGDGKKKKKKKKSGRSNTTTAKKLAGSKAAKKLSKSSKGKKSKKMTAAETSDTSDDGSSDSDSAASSSSPSDDDTSDSESLSSGSDSESKRKHHSSRKRRDADKTHKRVIRVKKSKRSAKVHESSDSSYDSDSESSDSDVSIRSGSSMSSSRSYSSSGSEMSTDLRRIRDPHVHAGGRLPGRSLDAMKQLQQLQIEQLWQEQKHHQYFPVQPPLQYVSSPVPSINLLGPSSHANNTSHSSRDRIVPRRNPPPLPPPGRSAAPLRDRMGRLTNSGDLQRRHGKSSRHRRHGRSSKKSLRTAFKRVDQIWDSSIHNYKLQDTAEGPQDAEYEGYLFHVRRTFDWEGKYKQTVVDIKSKLLRDGLREVMGDIKGVSLVDETPKLDPNLLFLYADDIRAHIKVLKKTKATADNKKARKKEQKNIRKRREQLRVLLGYLDKDYEAVKHSLLPMLENGLITFDLLWALWKPNTLAFTTTYGTNDQPRIFKAETAEKHYNLMKGHFYYLEGKYFEYDGKRFGFGSLANEIVEFRGARKITSLPVYPLKFHKNEEQLRKELVERGKKFVALSGVQYKSYEGMAYCKKKKSTIKVNITGRIMVDASIHRRINPNYPMSIVRPRGSDGTSDDESSDSEWGGRNDGCASDSDGAFGNGGLVLKEGQSKLVTETIEGKRGQEEIGGQKQPGKAADVVVEKATPVASTASTASTASAAAAASSTPDESSAASTETNGDQAKTKTGSSEGDAADADENEEADKKLPEFSDEEYLLASPVVLGFAFAEKLWLEFAVSSIKEIQWNESAYESLVLEPATKDIVRALVESHKYHAAESIDDVIQGKGKGLVAVLHGPPGTGKTLTAEGISELLKCPLYMVSAGELGTDSRYLESELQKVLDICHAWGAILLLDEADVFLEKRNMHDIHRNALVSIFLRQLEYFQGILFLTTNRVETFDDAFQSRIHIALRYDSLDQRAKKTIFKIFIERVRVLEKIELMPFSEEDYNTLARHDLNGRQIKNTVRTAQALAVNRREALSMSHIRQVLDVQMSFDRDLKGGPGFQDAMRSYF